MWLETTRKEVVAVVEQVVRRYGGRHARPVSLYEGHALARRHVLQHHLRKEGARARKCEREGWREGERVQAVLSLKNRPVRV